MTKSWNEFVTLDGPTPAIGPKAIYTNDAVPFFTKFSTASMGAVPVAGHFLDDTEKSQLEKGVSAVGVGTDNRKVDVSKQKQVSTVACNGIAQGVGVTGQAYVDRALLAIRGGLAYRNSMTIAGVIYDEAYIEPVGGDPYLPDGAFPAHKFGTSDSNHKLHNKMMFCEHAAHALRMIKDSAFYTGATATEVDALVVQIGEVAAWLIAAVSGTDDDFYKFYRNTENCNQLFRVAVGLHEIGLLTGNATYVSTAQTRMEEIFSATVQPGQTSRHVSPGGIFKEKRDTQGDVVEAGFDIGYQTVSLEILSTYWMSLSPGTWADTVFGFIVRGVARWLQVMRFGSGEKRRGFNRVASRLRPIIPGGLLDDANSTRTRVTAYVPSSVPVDWDRDVLGLRVHMWHYLGVSDELNLPLDQFADRIMLAGPSIGHRSDDNSDDDDL